MTKPALVVDGMSILRNCAGPAARLTNGYTHSFITQLTSTIKKMGPKGIFVCWEGGYDGRVEVYGGYKSDRKPTPPVIRQYRVDVKRFLTAAGIVQVTAPGYEADDVGAMLANTLPHVVLYSNDKDWLQLVRPGVSIFQKVRGAAVKQERKLITIENFSTLTGWESPDQFFQAQLAFGDGVDGIPGVGGIGEPVIKAYLMGMKVDPSKKEKLDKFYANSLEFQRNVKLMDLRGVKELPVLETVDGIYDERAMLNLLEELGFASIVKKFPEWVLAYRGAKF